jgi:NAD(P)-dependent dehydrogenase (short-subunit alcohol dehydrogenase family)
MTINPFDLTGLTVLVTGAGRGLGRSAAKMIAASGADIVGISRTLTELQSLRDEIVSDGGRCQIAELDVTDRGAVRALISGLDKLDGVINNAGWNNPQHALDVDDESFDQMMDINLRAAFTVAQAAAKRFVADGVAGSIVNMSSQMGHVGGPLRSVYCMTKFGLEGMTKAMAVDLAEHGIRVNTVAPTFVDTPLASQFLKDQAFHDFVIGSIPMRQLATQDQIAAACVYLLAPLAAMTTGTSLIVDGGWTAK